MCLLLIFNSTAVAIRNEPTSVTIDDISIYPQHGFVEGKTGQLTAILSPESAYKSLVEWSSSNPSVISCTEDGVIKGVSSGDYADITCKAKYGSAEDKIRIYCADSIGGYTKNEFNEWFTIIYAQPWPGKISAVYFNYNLILDFFKNLLIAVPNPGSLTTDEYKRNAQMAGGISCEVHGKYGSYAYVVIPTKSGGADGFVKYTRLKKDISDFLNLSAKDINVWGDGTTDPSKKLTTSYKGDVEWLVGDDTIVDFNKSTGQITGLKPGTTTITAKSDGMTKTCTVHSLYKWPQSWIGKANQNTSLYKAEGSGYKTDKTINVGTDFIVYGDDATDDGWTYGNIEGTDDWGYIPISHISTKGTISQYNNMGWSYPLKRTLFKNIFSPYGWRGDYRHLGFDINRQGSTPIEGEFAVAPFNGTVVFANTSYNPFTKKPDYGYCVVIEANDDKDPVSGQKLRAVYMHFLEKPMVDIGDPVIAGKTELGKIGSTGNSTGPHLHLEINNKGTNFAGSGNNDSFDKTINPIFFFLNSGLKDDLDLTYNEYWYNDNK